MQWISSQDLSSWTEALGVLSIGVIGLIKVGGMIHAIQEGFKSNREDHQSLFKRLDGQGERIRAVEVGLDQHLVQEDAQRQEMLRIVKMLSPFKCDPARRTSGDNGEGGL